MEDKDAGQRAISEMNGQEYMEFRMVVKEAEERGARPSRPPQGGGSGPSGGRSFGSSDGGSSAPRTSGGGFSKDKKPAPKKKKIQKSKPDKYSDGPRQTKMKKTRGGGGAKGWSDYDEEY
jgi:RNA recognition motif-containing protein